MPIYEYNCQDCKQIFEEWQKDYEERDIPCPVCGGQATRLISNTSFVLKGGGWYASGYSEDTGGAADKPASATPAAATPAAAAPDKPAEAPAASATAATS
jgi:putative FmdB family regulatory protein